MPRERSVIRNVTIQIHIPRGGERARIRAERSGEAERDIPGDEVLRAIVRTHVVHNLLVAYYCRQLRNWLNAEREEGAGEVERAMSAYVGEIFADDTDGTAAANASRGKYNPLTDPDSDGDGLRVLKDQESLRNMSEALERLLENPKAIEILEVYERTAKGGRTPGWMERADTPSGWTVKKPWPWDDGMQKKFTQWVAEKKPNESSPLAVLVKHGILGRQSPRLMKGLAELLELTPAQLRARRITAELGYGAFAQAASRLATHLSWKKRRAEERRNQQEKIQRDFGPHLKADWWKKLTEYEQEAAAFHEKVSGNASRAGYRLGDGGELKGWKRIRREWLKRRWDPSKPAATAEELRRIRIELQRLRPQDHGDHRLFDWLARPENWELWDGRDAGDGATREEREAPFYDRVSVRRRYTRESRELKGITWTWPDPLAHPLWAAYAEEGNPNSFPWFDLKPVGEGRGVSLALLFAHPEGGVEQRVVRLVIGENRRLAPDSEGRLCLDGVPAEIGGAKLLLKRSQLERILRTLPAEARKLLCDPENVTQERIERLVDAICGSPVVRKRGSIRTYLSLALSLRCEDTPDFLPMRKDTVARTGQDLDFAPRYVKPEALLRKEVANSGLRVLGVDLGVRHAASGAVLELVRAPDRKARKLPHVEGLYARVERTFPIKIEGEGGRPPRLDRAERAVRWGRWMVQLENDLARVSRRMAVLRESGNTTELAKEAEEAAESARGWLRELAEQWERVLPDLAAVQSGAALDGPRANLASALEKLAGSSRVDEEAVQAAWRAADELAIVNHAYIRHALSNPAALASGLRTAERRRARKEGRLAPPLPRFDPAALAMGGLSVERLELLDEALRYERRHATRSRPGNKQPRRLSRGQSIRPALREKLNRMKMDRCKKIAARIVEAALGGPEIGGKRKYAKCHVIALEDLARYRFSFDRPKRENRQLVAWSHREIFRWVKMLAEPHGILVAAVPAGYSSRFSGLTGAPGVRVERLDPDWCNQPWFKVGAEKRRHWLKAQPGDHVVMEGGPEFVSVGDRNPFNADENAAVNLAFRFFCPTSLVPVYLRLEQRDEDVFVVTTSGAYKGRLFRNVGEGVFEEIADGRKRKEKESPAEVDEAMDEEDSWSSRAAAVRVFRDLSSQIREGRWLEGGAFWAMVENRVIASLPVSQR